MENMPTAETCLQPFKGLNESICLKPFFYFYIFQKNRFVHSWQIFVVALQSNIFFSQNSSTELTYFFPQERRRRWRDTSNDGLGHICNPFCSALRAWPSPVLTTKFCHLKGIEQTRGGEEARRGDYFNSFFFMGSDPLPRVVHTV